MSARRRVALLGAGYIADWHARALASVAGVELVAVCDVALPRARELAAKHGVPGVHGSLEAMLAAERLDAVHVLLPPDRHEEAARALLEAGVDVLLEKPMAASAAGCEALVRQAAALGRKLGVGHNFLFAEPYERLRADLAAGRLGRIDHVAVTWHRELPQATHGPFDAWLLREPGNILLEVGSHAVAHLLDLCGPPSALRARASSPIELPGGRPFWRRWHLEADCGPAAVDLRLGFGPGFDEQTVHVRGTLAAATVDFVRNTYVLLEHRPLSDDLDRFAVTDAAGAALRQQARGTLTAYVLSKLKLRARGSPYGTSIARALDAFHGAPGPALDPRLAGRFGAQVIRTCEEALEAARLPAPPRPRPAPAVAVAPAAPPRILVLGGTGFIGRELVRQLVEAGHRVRLLVRSPGRLPPELRPPAVEALRGDLADPADVRRALEGIDAVYHLARADARGWAGWLRDEVEPTRRLGELAIEAGVRRFVYTGTIDSYYAGAGAGTITEATPLDPHIARRNLYARAKAASEAALGRLHEERGLPLVVLRPGVVIGRGGSPFHWGVGMWWHGAVCQTWGAGRHPLPLVLVEDVARALVAALDAPGLEGRSFNLVGPPLLSAQGYLDALDRAGGFTVQRHATPILRFFAADLAKWAVKVLVRHPERRLPSWRDWESRTQRATFDCGAAREALGWRPEGDREALIRRGIEAPLRDIFREGADRAPEPGPAAARDGGTGS
ncbi:MAG TPA: NAD-dependent epimerase/dehydratase family protein [Anaeromyxobacteraceae bacterium]|nr:NAD-dependent epimerase/dehydratase family protein [Anaeromyxobacteraceae bacterium]